MRARIQLNDNTTASSCQDIHKSGARETRPERHRHLDPEAKLLEAIAAVGLVDDERDRLALLDVIETNHADVGARVLRTALAHFVENFLGRTRLK